MFIYFDKINIKVFYGSLILAKYAENITKDTHET